MSLEMKVVMPVKASQIARYLVRELGDLTATNTRVAASEEAFFRDYLTETASFRHRTAQRLGAEATGFLERAAESPEGTADDKAAYIHLSPREAFARAFGRVTITPKAGSKWLTIPAHRLAYGRRAGTMPGLDFVQFSEDLAALVGRAKSTGESTVYYWLKKEVTQEQDRSLLPSDEAIGEVALEAIKDHFIEVSNKAR